MSSPSPAGDPDQRWQQPGFASSPADAPAVAAGDLVPAASREVAVPPPSAVESTLKVLSGLPWVVMIGLVFLGVGSWVPNIIIAIVASSVLGAIVAELDRRRKARAEFEAARNRPEELR